MRLYVIHRTVQEYRQLRTCSFIDFTYHNELETETMVTCKWNKSKLILSGVMLSPKTLKVVYTYDVVCEYLCRK